MIDLEGGKGRRGGMIVCPRLVLEGIHAVLLVLNPFLKMAQLVFLLLQDERRAVGLGRGDLLLQADILLDGLPVHLPILAIELI